SVACRQLDGPRDNRLKHGFEIKGRAKSAAHLPECGQLPNRPRQLVSPGLELTEQPCILDGDCRLVGEGFHEGDLTLAEGPNFVPKNGDHAEELIRSEHRDAEYGSGGSRVGLADLVRVRGIRLDVVYVDCASLEGSTGTSAMVPRVNRVLLGELPARC